MLNLGLSKYVYIVFITLICSLSAYVYFQQISIRSLTSEVTALDIRVKSQELVEERLIRAVEANKIVNQKLQVVNKEIKIELNTIKTHNLQNIAIKKPKLLERRVNDASDKIWNDIACFSDSSRLCD